MTYDHIPSTFGFDCYLPDITLNPYFGYNPLSPQETYGGFGINDPPSGSVLFSKDHKPTSSLFLLNDYTSIYNYARGYTENPMNYQAKNCTSIDVDYGRNRDYMAYRNNEESKYQKPFVQTKTFLARPNLVYNNKAFVQNTRYLVTEDVEKEYTEKNAHTIPESPVSTVSDISSQASSVKSTNITYQPTDIDNTIKMDTKSKSVEPPKKIHSCDFCKRKFARKYDANRHSRIHTGKKPYTCFCCHKSFSRSDAYNRHIRKEPSCFVFSEKHGLPKRTR
ncbi:unnamed protein product [Rhizopus stolonifer]